MTEKKLLIFSAIFLILGWCVVAKIQQRPSTFSLDVSNQFTYGKEDAPVHMILFEEFACPMCGLLNKEALPGIEEKYVETGKLKVTIVPIAFLDDSLPACTLALCVQKLAFTHMKHFYHFLFQLPSEDLITFSFRDFLSGYLETNGSLPAPQIIQHLKETSFEEEIEFNIGLVKQIYPGNIHLPLVLINGKVIKNPDQKTISKAIDEAL